jgi:hypothetical protein
VLAEGRLDVDLVRLQVADDDRDAAEAQALAKELPNAARDGFYFRARVRRFEEAEAAR